MFTRKVILAAVSLFFIAASAPAFACPGKPCPMEHRMRTEAMERTAGSVPVYNGPVARGQNMPKKCPTSKHRKAPHTGMMAMDMGKDMPAHHSRNAAPMHHGMHGMPQGRADTRAMNKVMTDMHRNMALPMTGDADADFIRGMIPHHQGAIDMARVVLDHGNDPQARSLARNIIRAQKGEIAWMKRWLAERNLPERAPINLNQ